MWSKAAYIYLCRTRFQARILLHCTTLFQRLYGRYLLLLAVVCLCSATRPHPSASFRSRMQTPVVMRRAWQRRACAGGRRRRRGGGGDRRGERERERPTHTIGAVLVWRTKNKGRGGAYVRVSVVGRSGIRQSVGRPAGRSAMLAVDGPFCGRRAHRLLAGKKTSHVAARVTMGRGSGSGPFIVLLPPLLTTLAHTDNNTLACLRRSRFP